MALRVLEVPGCLIPPSHRPATRCAHPCGIWASRVPGARHSTLYKSSTSALCLLLLLQRQAGAGPKMPFPSHLPRAAGLVELAS